MRDRVARVRVSDGTWNELRRVAAGRPISHVLAELVEREVAADRARRIRRGSVTERELLEALEDARALQEDVAALVDRIERRLDGAGGQRRLDEDWEA